VDWEKQTLFIFINLAIKVRAYRSLMCLDGGTTIVFLEYVTC
jgi:hypothetical protein